MDTRGEHGDGALSAAIGGAGIISDSDRYLPIANISRVIKAALPSDAKVSRAARDAIQESVSEFISFVTSEAVDRCVADKRKMITGDDLLEAIQDLGFDVYTKPLHEFLLAYRAANSRQSQNASSVVPVASRAESTIVASGQRIAGDDDV